jgi:hypothetical protein
MQAGQDKIFSGKSTSSTCGASLGETAPKGGWADTMAAHSNRRPIGRAVQSWTANFGAAGLILLMMLACGGSESDTPDAMQADRTSLRPADVRTQALGGADRVPLYGTLDLQFDAAETFRGSGGRPNPFTDVHLSIVLTSPAGSERTVIGFFNGDGLGGQDGSRFVVRVCPDEVGTWRWVSTSDVVSLDQLSGEFEAAGEISGPFRRGPIVVHPEHTRSFGFADGTPTYLIGKFLDIAAPEPIQFSHTLLSEKLSEQDRRNMLERHRAMGVNKMNIYVANKGDYKGVSTTPWLGSADRNDKDRFDLSRWQVYEHWVRELRESGIVAELWVFADDSNFGGLSTEVRDHLLNYTMARLSGYTNVVMVLCLEWQEGWTPPAVHHHAQTLEDHNPWDRLISTHGTTGDFSYPNAPWADYMVIQSGNHATAQQVYDMGLANRSLAPKPLLNEEFTWGAETDESRSKTWAALMAGGAGVGTGAFLKPFSVFVEQIDTHRLVPAADRLIAGDAYLVSSGDDVLHGYLYTGGRVTLLAAAETRVRWFDPRTGTFSPEESVLGPEVSLTAPGTGDWVVTVRSVGIQKGREFEAVGRRKGRSGRQRENGVL